MMQSGLNPLCALILAGGSGTRLWPLSREGRPKHLLALRGSETLLQQAARRLLPRISPNRIITVTHEEHVSQARQQLASIDPALTEGLLAEPAANNTLSAVAWGAGVIAQREPEAILCVCPSDHLIRDQVRFHADLERAIAIAQLGYLVTFGVRPTTPETGYGYLKAGAPLKGPGYEVERFVEKPDRATAEAYLKSGNYFWNSGMFVFKVKDFLEELQRLESTIHAAIARIVASANDPAVLREVYPSIKKVSIDYGVMEKAAQVAVVPASFKWNDLGSWEAIYDLRDKDEHQNVFEGDVVALDTNSSLVISQEGLVAAIGLKDMVIVQTGDAVLVSPRDRVQEVKTVVERLTAHKGHLIATHATVTRPWGTYTIVEEGAGFKVKRIVVAPGHKLSLQSHKHRAEHWVVVEGQAKITNGTKEIVLDANESAFIPQGEKHRLENPGTSPLMIIEVQTGSYLGEDDIERFDDIYGRA